MTSVTMQTVPTPKLEALTLMIITTDVSNRRPIFDMTAYVLSQWPAMGDQGLSGYSYYFGSYDNPFDGGNSKVGGMVVSVTLQDSSPEEMRKLWDPVLAHINATWPDRFLVIYQPTTFSSFLAWYTVNYDQTPAGLNSYLGSRLLDKAALTGDLAKSSRALEGFANTTQLATAYLVSGKGVHNAKPRGCGNAVLPAWRKAYVHASTLLPLDTRSNATE
jgi:hypothetical protein